jgi:glyoxylase I family protein
MARLRHIAIATDDPEATARFYREGLGLADAGRVDSPLADGYYLTDGHVNIAILRFKDALAATVEGAPKHRGLHHLGFGVDDLRGGIAQIQQAGASFHPIQAQHPEALEGRGANVEVKFTGPDGVMVDLSGVGWAGAS